MSIRRVTLTSGQNVKPPFLYQYLISFNDIFFILDISLRSTLKPKKITDLKVYSNLSQALHKFSREKIALISISFNPLRDCLIGVGGWVVGRGSWIVGRGSEIPMYTRHVYILLCCFKCPLATVVLSAISF